MRCVQPLSKVAFVVLIAGCVVAAARAADPKHTGKSRAKDEATAKDEVPTAPLRAGDKKPDEPAKPQAKRGGKSAKGHGRLPPYYAEVVDEKQTQKIHGIQDEYDKSIAKLQADIARLRRERDEKVANVLSAEQKQKLRRLIDGAKRIEKPIEDRPTATPRTEPSRESPKRD